MLPVVAGVEQTKRSIFLYTLLVAALTSMFFVTGEPGWFYFVSSAALGAGFIFYAYRLWRRPGIEGAKPLYLYSLAYLALLFAAMMVDATVLAAV